MYETHMGVPEMKQFGKAVYLLSLNPRHPGLHSHETTSLPARYGMKAGESYSENNAAGRMFRVYGPNQSDITIIGLEPHPKDKSIAYRKITLSQTGREVKQPKIAADPLSYPCVMKSREFIYVFKKKRTGSTQSGPHTQKAGPGPFLFFSFFRYHFSEFPVRDAPSCLAVF